MNGYGAVRLPRNATKRVRYGADEPLRYAVTQYGAAIIRSYVMRCGTEKHLMSGTVRSDIRTNQAHHFGSVREDAVR